MIVYSNAQYLKDMNGKENGIRADLNGLTIYIPLDPANTDFAAIQKLVAEGQLTIAPAEGDK